MTPTEAGFDGAKGVKLPMRGENLRFQLTRGKQLPSEYPNRNFCEQLLWVYPDNASARLLWCNAEGQWFELNFTPIEKP